MHPLIQFRESFFQLLIITKLRLNLAMLWSTIHFQAFLKHRWIQNRSVLAYMISSAINISDDLISSLNKHSFLILYMSQFCGIWYYRKCSNAQRDQFSSHFIWIFHHQNQLEKATEPHRDWLKIPIRWNKLKH